MSLLLLFNDDAVEPNALRIGADIAWLCDFAVESAGGIIATAPAVAADFVVSVHSELIANAVAPIASDFVIATVCVIYIEATVPPQTSEFSVVGSSVFNCAAKAPSIIADFVIGTTGSDAAIDAILPALSSDFKVIANAVAVDRSNTDLILMFSRSRKTV